MTIRAGTVKSVWQYPVKSMGGLSLAEGILQPKGMRGDRTWAVRDEERDELCGAKKLPRLLTLQASYVDSPPEAEHRDVAIAFPDGRTSHSDQQDIDTVLSDYLGHSVSLCSLSQAKNKQHFRLASSPSMQDLRKQLGFSKDDPNPDFSAMPISKLLTLSTYVTPPGTYYDAYPLHILTTASLDYIQSHHNDRQVDERRFRPNILIDTVPELSGLAEFDWCGGSLFIGDVIIKCEIPTIRCAMPAYAQPHLSKDAKIVRTVRDAAGRHLGIYARVIQGGTIKPGDPVLLNLPSKAFPRRQFIAIKQALKREILSIWGRMIAQSTSSNQLPGKPVHKPA